MPYEIGKYPNRIGLRYAIKLLLPSPALLTDSLVVGNQQLGAKRRGIGLPHVPCEDVEKVSCCAKVLR